MIIGVEGVSCAGKTALANALVQVLDNPLVVPCYYHAAPHPDLLPAPVAASGEEQLAGLTVLLEVEHVRRRRAEEAVSQGRDVIFDRTVDTLLAHTHAVSALHGFPIVQAARQLVLDARPLLPDLTLLLHTSPTVLAARAAKRPGMPPIFYAPDFAQHFIAHFSQPLAPYCTRLDSTPPTAALVPLALRHIQRSRRAPGIAHPWQPDPEGPAAEGSAA
ncbi:nucleoside/nucleotide kinase family protein [Streptomyces fulvoviolaceus]|uniref:hypothetical protein n=1 Tax=Streptomyces fulvoviolaceus TaxID=285535 RepID=UPI0021C06E53|nr:hypothetical protein [Streptomyces fulvoviolaceus]MCT9080447.1 hypothetical protein [Streptomyces fulvoviolaceus]